MSLKNAKTREKIRQMKWGDNLPTNRIATILQLPETTVRDYLKGATWGGEGRSYTARDIYRPENCTLSVGGVALEGFSPDSQEIKARAESFAERFKKGMRTGSTKCVGQDYERFYSDGVSRDHFPHHVVGNPALGTPFTDENLWMKGDNPTLWRGRLPEQVVGTIEMEKEEDNSRILLISDMHIPYHHQDMIPFLKYLKRKYNPTRVISLGDECFPSEAEVLTWFGWMSFGDYYKHWTDTGELLEVMQVDEDLVGSFVQPERLVYKENAPFLLRYEHNTLVSCTTPKHNLVKQHPETGELHRREAWDSSGSEDWYIPRTLKGVVGPSELGMTHDQIRLMVAFQVSGIWMEGAARFAFTDQHRAERLIGLLSSLRIPYNTYTVERGDSRTYIVVGSAPHYLSKYFNEVALPSDLSSRQARVLCDELEYWGGTPKKGQVCYESVVKDNVEFVHAVAAIAGYCPRKIVQEESGYYRLDIDISPENVSLKSAKKELIPHHREVFCVTVPTGMILTRQEGWVSVSGNCDKHALSFHNSDPDLPSAGDELKAVLPVIAELKEIFPVMDILESNHGSMIYRKAMHHGLPRHYIKPYNEVLGVDKGWTWHPDLSIELPNGNLCYFHHGKSANVTKTSQTMSMCAVQGHYHEAFKVEYWGNPLALYWAMQIGCLIDDKSYAFNYNNVNLKRPIIGTGLIINSMPVLEPMVLDKNGRWIGE